MICCAVGIQHASWRVGINVGFSSNIRKLAYGAVPGNKNPIAGNKIDLLQKSDLISIRFFFTEPALHGKLFPFMNPAER